MSVPKPEFLFLTINEICNLRCQHCDYWRTKQPELNVISLERQEEILREFAELSPGGKLVICGGEPMLDVNTYFHVCKVAHENGLQVLSVVNGTMITSEQAADRVIWSGPDEISISLDGPTTEIHDRLRGRKGSFDIAKQALQLLLSSRRRRLDRHTKIYVMGLLTMSTYRHLDAWYDLVLNEIGADKLKLNSLQPTFMHQRLGQIRQNDLFFAKESQVDPDELLAILMSCQKKYGLNYNPSWVSQVVSYFRKLYKSPEDLSAGWGGGFATEEHICNSPLRNIMIDLDGCASLCFSNLFDHVKLEQKGDLRCFWEGAVGLRERMGKCNALCGISHSVRREHASLPILPGA